VIWWGRFIALCSEESEWELEFRAEFRERSDRDSDSTAIGVHEMDDFIAFIGEYGY
jgi:hypothetical protein